MLGTKIPALQEPKPRGGDPHTITSLTSGLKWIGECVSAQEGRDYGGGFEESEGDLNQGGARGDVS